MSTLRLSVRDELDRSAAEDRMLLAQRDHPLHPVEQRERRALLRLDVDRFVAVDRIHDRGKEQPSPDRQREKPPLRSLLHCIGVRTPLRSPR